MVPSALLALLAAAASLLPAAAQPTPLRSRDAEDALQRLVSRLEVGAPLRFRNLTVFPVTLARPRDSDFLTLDEALRRGALKVSEVGTGRVNEVYVENDSGRYVFMMAGEVIVGAKQDRMISDDTLVPPKSGRLLVKVYCTEHGRWSGPTLAFGSSGLGVFPEARAAARQSGSQSEVWAQIQRKRDAVAPGSAPTEALRGVQENVQVQRRIEVYRAPRMVQLPRASSNTVGVVVAVSGRIRAADVFGGHDLLAALWSKLLDSYAMDAIETVSSYEWRQEVTQADARRFLRQALSAKVARRSTPGVGELLSVEASDASGQALVYQGDLVHLELFPRDTRLIRDRDSGLRSPYRVVPQQRRQR